MAEDKVDQEHSVSPILSSVEDPEKRKVLNEIEALGLTEKLLELEAKAQDSAVVVAGAGGLTMTANDFTALLTQQQRSLRCCRF